jgi:ABC-type phosphonate transport system ATPase subunit
VVPADEHVVGLDVAVQHALLMRVRQRVDDVAQQAHGVGNRQLALAGELGAKRLALDEGHGVVEEIAGTAGRQ